MAQWRIRRVWLNGHELGGRPYGYIGFSFDLTPYLKFGAANVIAVRLTPEDRSSRWYPGAGIYRNVWLDITGPVHVARWGTYVTTPEVSGAQSSVAVKTEVQNRLQSERKVTLQTSVLDAAGKVVSPHVERCGNPRGRLATPSRARSTSRIRSAGIRSSVSLHAGQRSGGRQDAGGPLHHAVRHPHHRVRQRQGLPAQRPRHEDPGRLQPSRPGRAGRGRQPPRDRDGNWRS